MISSFSLSSVHIPPLPKPNQIQRKNWKSSSSPTETLTPTPKDLLDNFNTVFELKQLHSYIIKTNKDYSILLVTRIASICALSPSFDYARTIFRRVEKNETFIWNSYLKTYAESESPINAIRFFYRLRQSNLCPDTFTCSFVLKACSILLDLHNGRIVHGLVLKLGYQSDLFLQNTIVHMYAKGGAINDARKLFEKMPRRDSVTWNILITQLTKLNEIDKAQELFDQMPDKSVRSWMAMIAGYVQCGKPKEAVKLFKQMEEAGESPNEVTVVAVLAACAYLGTLDLGRHIHEYLDKCGFRKNVRMCNTLIDMYIKCGCLESARSVFDEMEERTIVSWSAMIGGLAMHGEGEESLKLFSKMTRIGIRPNDVTFVGLLHACSHMGLIAEGREFFTSMRLLSEAHEFIKNMPIKANGVVWGALLGGCRVHKNIELAEEAIKHLQVLDPRNDGYYVVLSNIYAEKGRWEETTRKTPGWSTVTVNGEVHEFVDGDGNHPQAEEIYQKRDELLTQMKPRGYIPNTKVVLLYMDGEENKVQVLYRHSEKLAIMFGLMKTPPGTTIRIMKNLRVCEDCHSSFKLISDIIDREIVVRDRNRFHCFKNGLCSCRDYW
ncbi:hypothetical protein MKW98_022192 [Papaver atlanticum]|uniref:DYW domain-containing protein n=1 Tax=Papaver atlanticum TaxID=357466 RepID=A0AAD4T6E4_9MAGN|nr:hypothetical protein MKW98_022192 [Papaver atlanticum]